uniref:Uncharacterized protein n=1 Tax=Magallana gigas TaxID=29159 RepID=A0A8W8MG88_MAGGI
MYPTKQGLSLRIPEWNRLKNNLHEINFQIPVDLGSVVPCYADGSRPERRQSGCDIPLHQREINLTQGGGPAGKPLTPLAEAVESVIGTDNISISGIPGAVDTTFLMLDNEHNTANIATKTVEQRSSAVVQDLQILSTNESGDGQINLVTLPARKCNTCSCSIDSCMGDLQKRKLELEKEYFTLRNTLVKLQIERLQNESE